MLEYIDRAKEGLRENEGEITEARHARDQLVERQSRLVGQLAFATNPLARNLELAKKHFSKCLQRREKLVAKKKECIDYISTMRLKGRLCFPAEGKLPQDLFLNILGQICDSHRDMVSLAARQFRSNVSLGRSLRLFQKKIVKVAAGWDHTCMISIDGELLTCGSGRIGHGQEETVELLPRVVQNLLPSMTTSGERARVIDVACGGQFTVAVVGIFKQGQSDWYKNSLYTFGDGDSGELGGGRRESRGTPSELREFSNVSWYDFRFAKVVAGDHHVLALTSTGRVFSWGCGDEGRLGLPTLEIDVLIPIQIPSVKDIVVTDIAAGCDYSILLTEHGGVLTFGSNRFRRLGHTTAYPAPNPLSAHVFSKPTVVAGLADMFIVAAAAGQDHSVFLSKDGEVFSCGNKNCGSLGLGLPPLVISDFDDEDEGDGKAVAPPRKVEVGTLESGEAVVHVSAGEYCTLLVTTRGRLFRFGSTTGGPWQLKQESSIQTVPTLVEALARHRVTSVAGGQFHVVICTHDGEVFTYGGDVEHGRLGHGPRAEEEMSSGAPGEPVAVRALGR